MRQWIASMLAGILVFSSVPVSEVKAALQTPIPFQQYHVPSSIGYVTDTYKGSDPRTVVLIQDLHSSYEAQKNISSLFEYFDQKKLLPTFVAVEGATGLINTSILSSISDATVRSNVSDYLMNQLELPGPGYYAVTQGKPNLLYGVENSHYYDLHKKLFQETYEVREKLAAQLERFEKPLQRAAGNELNRSTKKLLTLKNRYESAKIDLIAYAKNLLDIHNEMSFALDEKTSPLLIKMEKNQLSDELLNQTPVMNQLTSETHRLQAQLAKQSASTSLQQNLVLAQSNVTLLKKLLAQQVTETEVSLANTQFAQLTETIRVLLKPTNEELKAFQEAVRGAIDFYIVAALREKPMVDNTLSQMAKEKTSLGFLVMGGFHTLGIADQLRKQGVSYVVITPSITRLDGIQHKLYEARLMNEHVTDVTNSQDFISSTQTSISSLSAGYVVFEKIMHAPLARVVALYTYQNIRRQNDRLDSKTLINQTVQALSGNSFISADYVRSYLEARHIAPVVEEKATYRKNFVREFHTNSFDQFMIRTFGHLLIIVAATLWAPFEFLLSNKEMSYSLGATALNSYSMYGSRGNQWAHRTWNTLMPKRYHLFSDVEANLRRLLDDNSIEDSLVLDQSFMEAYGRNIEWYVERLVNSTAGVRGIVDYNPANGVGDLLGGPQLNAAVVFFVAQAYANFIKELPEEIDGVKIEKAAFVGYDERQFSHQFADIFTRVLMGNGIKVYRDENATDGKGLSPTSTATPVSSYAAFHFRLAEAIEITASHNPANQCGVKSQSWTGGVDLDSIGDEIGRKAVALFDEIKKGKTEIKVAAMEIGEHLEFLNAKEIYYQNYWKRLFPKERILRLQENLKRSSGKVMLDGLFGVAGPTFHYYLDRMIEDYQLDEELWRTRFIIRNEQPDMNIGGIAKPDPSSALTLELAGDLAELVRDPSIRVVSVADMDADRIGTATIIPANDVARARELGLFVTEMKSAEGSSVFIVRFTANQIFNLLAYGQGVEAVRSHMGYETLEEAAAVLNDLQESGNDVKLAHIRKALVLITTIVSSMIGTAMMGWLGGTIINCCVGFKYLGDQSYALDKAMRTTGIWSIVIAILEESGGLQLGPVSPALQYDEGKKMSIHRDKCTLTGSMTLFEHALRLDAEGRNLLDFYAEMAQNLGGLFYYERLDAYLPTQRVAESLQAGDLSAAAAAKLDVTSKAEALENEDQGPQLLELFRALFGTSTTYVSTEKVTVNDVVFLLKETSGAWNNKPAEGYLHRLSNGWTIQVFHIGMPGKEGPAIRIFNPDGKEIVRTALRKSGTEALVRLYMEIFEPFEGGNPQHLITYFEPLIKHLGLDQYRLQEHGPDYLTAHLTSIGEKYPQNVNFEKEKLAGAAVSSALHTPFEAEGGFTDADYRRGGYQQNGYGVPSGSALNGSFALYGEQGYYTPSGKERFLSGVKAIRGFFERHKQKGHEIKYVIKIGIGGQHTPFQGLADKFSIIDAETGEVVGIYELGTNHGDSLRKKIADLGISWKNVAVIPSSKSGSTDETMLIFSEVLYASISQQFFSAIGNIAVADREKYERVVADAIFHRFNQLNLPEGEEKPGDQLFSVKSAEDLVTWLQVTINIRLEENQLTTLPPVSEAQVVTLLKDVLGRMVFETTPNASESRLAAFIKNSKLDKILGEDQPVFVEMYENVGGRWTGDLHMMTFLAFNNLEEEIYWRRRQQGIEQVRQGTHDGNKLGNKILDEGITDIALVVPDDLFWFGKATEQNFNESIWQPGFANLVAIPASMWKYQAHHYQKNPKRLVINMTSRDISKDNFNVYVPEVTSRLKKKKKDVWAENFADLFTTFYGMTNTVGTRLIAREIHLQGKTTENIPLGDLNHPVTKIVQALLFLRQPFVELGKKLLEKRLQAFGGETAKITKAMQTVQGLAESGEFKTTGNVTVTTSHESPLDVAKLTDLIQQGMKEAQKDGRKFVPFLYLEGKGFVDLREALTKMGIEWVMQGTGDQHISYQQVLAQPQKFFPFIISFVPTDILADQLVKDALPAIGFGKSYLHRVPTHLVRDYFAEASFDALSDQGGKGIFIRVPDNAKTQKMVKESFSAAVKSVSPRRGKVRFSTIHAALPLGVLIALGIVFPETSMVVLALNLIGTGLATGGALLILKKIGLLMIGLFIGGWGSLHGVAKKVREISAAIAEAKRSTADVTARVAEMEVFSNAAKAEPSQYLVALAKFIGVDPTALFGVRKRYDANILVFTLAA